jgi:spore maturation protein SpmB
MMMHTRDWGPFVCRPISFLTRRLLCAVQACQRHGIADLCHNIGAQIIYLLRAASLGMLVVSNIVMTTSFTRAMHLTSSLTATVATTSFNFTFTAIMSMLVFGETLPPLW